jgi:hypothetical protein
MMLYALAALFVFPAGFAAWIAGELNETADGKFGIEPAIWMFCGTYVVCWVTAFVCIVIIEERRYQRTLRQRVARN